MRGNIHRYWEKRRLQRIVRSESARKVYELTGWVEPRALPIREHDRVVGYDYTVGFLMRKVLPDYVRVKYKGPNLGWEAQANHQNEEDGHQWSIGTPGQTAREPEDAVCKLIIEFIERGYITKEAS
jgi:hypothetical protein